MKFAPAEAGEKRLDLSIDGDQAAIKLSSWVEGLGWCGEKTMRVDADMLDEMHRLIASARVRMRQRGSVENAPSKVLQFPTSA